MISLFFPRVNQYTNVMSGFTRVGPEKPGFLKPGLVQLVLINATEKIIAKLISVVFSLNVNLMNKIRIKEAA